MSPTARRSLPRTVWALGLVSLLMDSSSELVHALLPLYMTTVLGASMLEVGLIEGVAEGIAAITKVFSGTLSDWLGRRKLLVVLGYGLAALSKPLFPLANGIGLVAGARFMDRVGKGIRGAPRDALIADIAPAHLRGASFGLRQALDTVGAFLRRQIVREGGEAQEPLRRLDLIDQPAEALRVESLQCRRHAPALAPHAAEQRAHEAPPRLEEGAQPIEPHHRVGRAAEPGEFLLSRLGRRHRLRRMDRRRAHRISPPARRRSRRSAASCRP